MAEHDAYLCLMHMQGDPRSMQVAPRYEDVVSEVAAFLEERAEAAVAEGVRRESICVDPGIGFGKTPDQNLELVRRLDVLAGTGYPSWPASEEHARQGPRRPRGDQGHARGLAGAAVAAFERGAWMLRVHDVAETVDAPAVAAAVERGMVSA